MSIPCVVFLNAGALLAQIPGMQGQGPVPVPLPHPEIEAPAALPGSLAPWVIVLSLLITTLLIALVLWLLFKQRAQTPGPRREPRAAAIKALRELRAAAGGLQPSDIGHRVSEILRTYFMARYEMPAPFRTTPELFGSTAGSRRDLNERFGPLATIYDEIAFAPQPFTGAQAQSLIENAIHKMEEERS